MPINKHKAAEDVNLRLAKLKQAVDPDEVEMHKSWINSIQGKLGDTVIPWVIGSAASTSYIKTT